MIQRIILSVDDSPAYLQFWPMVATAWRRVLAIEPELAHVTATPDESMSRWGSVHAMEPVDGMPSCNQAKISRLILASMFPDEICMLSDIDMLPLSPGAFIHLGRVARDNDGKIACFGADAFAHVDTDKHQDHGIVPICYLAARGHIFGDMLDSVPMDTLRTWTHLKANPYESPFSDEAMLRHMGIADLIIGGARGWRDGIAAGRIDRDVITSAIDMHMPR